MNEENKNGTDATSKIAEEQMNKTMQKGAKKTGKMAMKALKKGAKMILKAVFGALKSLVIAILPYLLIAILIFYLFTVIFDTIFESRGKEQGYQMEDEKHDNKLKKNKQGQWQAINLSPGNKVVKAFYTYFSDRSYYITVGDEKKLYTAEDPEIKSRNIKDKNDREKMFYLSPNMLWTLDEFLFENKFRFPEQFLKPVYHDPETLEAKPLTDDKGLLVAESNSYDTKDVRIADKKEKGVWDYGFAPILHYQEYEEQKEGRGKVLYEDVWDEEKQQVVQKQNIAEDKQEEHKKAVEGFPKKTWMIDKVASPAGNISNKITNEWKDTGERYEEKISFKQKVKKWKMVTKTRAKTNGVGLPLFKEANGSETIVPNSQPITETYEEKEWYEEEVTMFRYAEGTMWEQTPEYDGEPDTSGVTGNRYFKDYLQNFKSRVPIDAAIGFNVETRTNKDIKELEALLKEHDEKDAQAQQGGGQVDMGEFKLGEGADSENYKKSLQYIEIFKKYGEMFGVDPYLLVAKASQESGGDHEGSLPGGRGYNGAAVGLMQVEKPGEVIKGVTAFNFQTKKEETMNISGPGDVTDVDANIKAGTMEFASRLKGNFYNVLLSIQAYNYGPGGTNAIVDLYAKETGKTSDEIRQNTGDTGWMKFRDEVHNNPSKYFKWSGSTYGDAKYIEHVLRYYASPESKAPWVMKEDGTKVMADGNLEVGSASGLEVKGGGGDFGFGALIKNIFGKLKEFWGTLFPDKPLHDPMKPIEAGIMYKNQIRENRSQDVINMMFVMEEQKYLSEFDDMTDEMWKERFSQLFKNPLGTSWGGKKNGLDVNKVFPDGFSKPVDIDPPTIVKPFGLVPEGESKGLHQAIDILTPSGTEIKSVSDKGKVINISNAEGGYLGKMVEVQYKNAIVIYGNLGTVDVKEGQEIKKGDKIGTAGGTTESGEVMHLEVVYKGQRVDATPFVTGEGTQSGGGNGTSTPGGGGPMSIEGSQKAQEIYGYLKEFIGSWYAWGGTTPPKKLANGEWEPARKTGAWIGGYPVEYPGFDCSGFMQYGYKKAGVNIPRTAREQQAWATNIAKDQAQPGDLVFWGKPAHHVGMYIGNNEYIHAPQSNDRIKVSKINNWGSVTSVGRALK
ncbi:NlpC/P60 family protein [Bacillus cereus]|uniref:NlpC/P60 family protein n=1 Tax=Bacillus cereus TaxID=1396 RepID=UPI000BF5141B|nr:NlpC/P60 family protein [Bacillus cereus]PFQ27743.1 hypothetical protein COK33_31585 [Bacillus cereus]